MTIKKILMAFSFAAFTPAIVAQELNSGDT
jgi:hypothetical protein